MATEPGNGPRPFLKWAGGKRQLAAVIRAAMPAEYDTYIEPFIGGGAMLFAVQPEKAIIADINAELINAYRMVQRRPEELLVELARHENSAEYFYAMRAAQPAQLSEIDRAGRFIYLNRTCFNGLYRENSSGQFNVPFGNYKHPTIADGDNLRAVAAYLNRADITILNADYTTVLARAGRGDFVYLDPPYHPIGATAFTKYHRGDFAVADQQRLAELFGQLAGRGVKALQSNANAPFIRDLYCDCRVQEVAATRAISCKGAGRQRQPVEVLIANW